MKKREKKRLLCAYYWIWGCLNLKDKSDLVYVYARLDTDTTFIQKD